MVRRVKRVKRLLCWTPLLKLPLEELLELIPLTDYLRLDELHTLLQKSLTKRIMDDPSLWLDALSYVYTDMPFCYPNLMYLFEALLFKNQHKPWTRKNAFLSWPNLKNMLKSIIGPYFLGDCLCK